MYNRISSAKKGFLSLMLLSSAMLYACGSDSDEPDTPAPVVTTSAKITVKPATGYQEMIGFGGALTWYSERVASSSKSEELYKLMFQDLGMDILRLKNWYYPLNYPENKSPSTMLTDGDKNMFSVNQTFYQKAKAANPALKVLLSSWGPPPNLKSNGNLREGTLKKDAQGYMYDAYATYWSDVLDYTPFKPDYISIQNEPGYVNAGWTTCQWAPTETATLAGFEKAFEAVHEKIKDKANAPAMIGPEAENIPAFFNFSPVAKDKSYSPVYAYHPYNFNDNTNITQTTSLLSDIHSRFGDKPNMMTEYSSMGSWLKTARFIQQTMRYAYTSGYIYWELVWGDASTKDKAMIYIDASGNYTVTPYYYVMKHFAKFIDAGYQRVDVAASAGALEITAYMNPDQNQLTLVIINPESRATKYQVEVENKAVKSMKGYQSVEGTYYKEMGALAADGDVSLAASSLTTLVLTL